MPATSTAVRTRLRLERMKEQYGLTEKQAQYVDLSVTEPKTSRLSRAKKAGYGTGVTKKGYRVLKSTKLTTAIVGEVRRRGNIAVEMEEMRRNPREYLKTRFVENASDPTVTAVQHASLEAVAKLDGLFTQKIEVETGEKTRALWVLDRIRQQANITLLAQPSEETS